MDTNKTISIVLKLSVLLFFTLLVGGLFISYNSLVSKEEKVFEAWSQVESTYQRRLDLIGNLVKTVKQFAIHEKDVLLSVTKERSGNIEGLLAQIESQKNDFKNTAINLNDEKALTQLLEKEQALSKNFMKLLVSVEAYPNLKSSENFFALQSQIEGTENRINITRMLFNTSVKEFNAYKRKIPANIISNIAGFKRKAYFKSDSKANKKVDINFN